MTIAGIQTTIVDHLLRLGLFDHVGRHEPAQSPGKGHYAAVWFNRVAPDRAHSTVDAPSVLYEFNIRLYDSANREPADDIDIGLVEATDAVIASLISDLDLSAAISVDVLGMASDGLGASTDFVNYKDRWHRVVDISLPVMVEGAWGNYGV